MPVPSQLSFVVGIYVGIYIDQHYQVPRVDDPSSVWTQVREYAKQFEKDKKDK